MAQENDILIKVEVDTARLTSETNAAVAELQKLKVEQAGLNKQLREGTITSEEYGAKVTANKQRMQDLTKTIKDNTSMLAASAVEEVKTNATLDQKRAALNALQKAYGQMTDEQKNAEIGGKTLTARIKELSDVVKDEEAAIGDTRRNVGNYTESLQQAFPALGRFASGTQSVVERIKALPSLLGNMPQLFSGLAGGIKSATTAALKFLATPVGAVVGAIAVALKMLVSAFNKLREQIALNDEASTNLARVYAVTVQPIIDGLTKVFAGLANIVGKVAGAIADFAGGLSDAGKKSDDYVKRVDNLEEAERQYTVNSAKRNAEIAKLRDEAARADEYSVEDRRKALEDALKLEQENLDDEQKIAKERLALLEQKAEREKDTSDATKNKIAEARAAMSKAEENYYTGTRRMQTQLQSFNKEIDAQDKQRLEDYKKRLEERKQAEMEAYWEQREIRETLESVFKREPIKVPVVELDEEEDDSDVQADLERMKELLERRREMQKSERQKEMESEIAFLDELHKYKLISEEDYQKQVGEIKQRYLDEERAAQLAAISVNIAYWGEAVMSTLSSINEAWNALDKAELEDYKQTQDRKKKELDKRLKAGEISEAQYQSEVQRLDEETDRKEKDMQREQAKRDKALGIMQAGISTAAAIIGFLADPGGFAGIALSAMAAITGIAQTAAIAAEPLPQFATGGVVPGNSYSGDNVLARVNSGEVILPQDKAARLYDAVSGEGDSLGTNYEMLAAAVAAQPAPVVVYKELREFSGRVATYDELARL